MDKTRAAIRLLDAIAGGVRRVPSWHGGDRIVAVSRSPMLALDAVRAIAGELDWRVDTVDAVRTNLHDLVEDSPLRAMVHHAREARHQHVVVVQSAVPALLEDLTYRTLLEGMAIRLPVVLCMEEAPGDARGWTVVDLEGGR